MNPTRRPAWYWQTTLQYLHVCTEWERTNVPRTMGSLAEFGQFGWWLNESLVLRWHSPWGNCESCDYTYVCYISPPTEVVSSSQQVSKPYSVGGEAGIWRRCYIFWFSHSFLERAHQGQGTWRRLKLLKWVFIHIFSVGGYTQITVLIVKYKCYYPYPKEDRST